MERALAFVTIACLAFAFAFVVFADYLFGAAALAWFVPGAAVVCALTGGLGWWFSRKRVVAGATLAVTAGLLALNFMALSPVRPFRAFYRQLEPGMSETEVLSALERAFPAAGCYSVPAVAQTQDSGDTSLSVTLDPADRRYNSEIIVARFKDGGLTAADYLPD